MTRLVFALVLAAACDSSSPTSSCGTNTCGACQAGCVPADTCVNGYWRCACTCGDLSVAGDLSMAGDLAGADLSLCAPPGGLPTSFSDAGAIRYDCVNDNDCAWRAEGCFDFCTRATEPSHFTPCAAACNPALPACTCDHGTCTACYAGSPFCGS